jgi:hypothetical protein
MRFNVAFRTLAVAAVVGASACGGNDKTADNAALQNDLSLAAQQQTRLDSVSSLEAGAAAKAPVSNVAPATARRTTSSAPRRTTSTTRRSSSAGTSSGSDGSSAGASSSPGTVTTSSGGEVTVKNTKRDAAIGAAAGAVIGATTSRNKVKGAVIGGAVGAILGGVVGNNVDVKKKKPPV